MGPVCRSSPVNLPRQDWFPYWRSAGGKNLSVTWRLTEADVMQISIAGLQFFSKTYSLHPFIALQRISHTIHWLVYGLLSALILSCNSDVSVAVDHGYNSFFPSFFLHCLPTTCCYNWPASGADDQDGDPLGSPQSEKSCERWRERGRDWDQHVVLCFRCALSGWSRCSLRRDATFMQHKAVISVQELLERHWHGVSGADRRCHPNSVARPPTTRVVCLGCWRPWTMLRVWSHLGTDHSTNHWGWFNCATLG